MDGHGDPSQSTDGSESRQDLVDDMKHYRRLQALAVAALLAELVVGLGGTLTPRKEIFPFASWFLFSTVPYETTDFDLILRTLGDQPLEPARAFSQGSGLVSQPHSIVAYQVIQQLGDAEKAHDAARIQALRRQIEGQFLVPAIHYDLVRVTYAPLERWQTGRALRTEPVCSFVYGQP